jgi:hypothetical protein
MKTNLSILYVFILAMFCFGCQDASEPIMIGVVRYEIDGVMHASPIGIAAKSFPFTKFDFSMGRLISSNGKYEIEIKDWANNPILNTPYPLDSKSVRISLAEPSTESLWKGTDTSYDEMQKGSFTFTKYVVTTNEKIIEGFFEGVFVPETATTVKNGVVITVPMAKENKILKKGYVSGRIQLN